MSSTTDPIPGDDAPGIPDNDRSFLMDQAPVDVDAAQVREHTDDPGEPGTDADAARS